MKYVFAFCLAVVVSRGVLGAAPVTIVEHGESRATIVVAAGEEHARQAAEALQKYVEKMSGAKIDILQEGEESAPTGTVSIYVGHTVAAKKNGVEIPSGFDPSIRADAFEEEGYVLKTEGDNIFIGGNSDGPYRGTLYGAYAFLEKLGCRWYFPGEWGEIVPKLNTVTVPDLDVESRPDFPLRYISCGGGWLPTTEDEDRLYNEWCTKIGFNESHTGLYPNVGDGMLARLLPTKEFWEQHPEYYAVDKNGQRHIGSGDVDGTTMLCLSNPEVFSQVRKNLEEAFAGKRYLGVVSPNGFGISPPDGTPYCYCEECSADSLHLNYPRYFGDKRTMSEEFFGFAARLAKEFPDKYVATMAYSLREMPPQGVTVPPNMTVMYAPITTCALHPNDHPSCWRRQEYVKMLEWWRRQTPHVYVYDYNPHFFVGLYVPLCQLSNISTEVPMYKEMDLKGINAEGRKGFMQTWISYYVTAKLLWDAETDIDALKEEFYTDFFGPDAGPHVQAWWDACEKALLGSTVHVNSDYWVSHIYTSEFVEGIHKYVEAARDAELTEVQRKRVEAFALIADNLAAYAEMHQADQRLDYAKAVGSLERIMEIQEKLHGFYSFFITPRAMLDSSAFVYGRKKKHEQLVLMTNGEKGRFVAPLPLEMPFARDRFNEGVIGEWYAPDFDDSAWGAKNTYFVASAQGDPVDEKGHGYTGHMWYRGTFEVPAEFENKPVHIWFGGAWNEVWLWVNGEYAGHHPYREAHSYGFNFDVSALVRSGEKNSIAIRVWNQTDLGGLCHRGFFWSPTEEPMLKELLIDWW
jgi:hypothetical protein